MVLSKLSSKLASFIRPKAIEFLRKHRRDVGISSFCLGFIEKLLDSDFGCPCQSPYNESLCAFYAIVPFFVCFIYTLCDFEESSVTEGGGKEDKSKRNVSSSTDTSIMPEARRMDDVPESQDLPSGDRAAEQENRGTENVHENTTCSNKEEEKSCCTKEKCLYSLLISFIWLFFFFIDGHYVACACSHWGGEYTVTGALKWCKPKGNETEVFGRLQETQWYVFISQMVGFAILLLIGLMMMCCCLKLCCKGGSVCCCAQNKQKASEEQEVPQSGLMMGTRHSQWMALS
ncbi:uncharacterized protein LOC113634620 isoform X2 [Tachysurus fulvidraco]|uniref:uncharacterized protein LOC113634620 isoform X2 n=1 Tax=Tachysurus fulvidraco TaxID=1234273 RepID=UPI001FED6442|nr:uncharacterized protein LOC113634620 isoform X2 [Tachysurus fulvidraco]